MALPLVTGTDRASPTGPVVAAHPRKADGWLAHLPVSLFAAAMGIGGLSLAWRRAASAQIAPGWIGQALFWVAISRLRSAQRLVCREVGPAPGRSTGRGAAPDPDAVPVHDDHRRLAGGHCWS